jgi:hypothetical protein
MPSGVSRCLPSTMNHLLRDFRLSDFPLASRRLSFFYPSPTFPLPHFPTATRGHTNVRTTAHAPTVPLSHYPTLHLPQALVQPVF